jgi:hypothetical protein
MEVRFNMKLQEKIINVQTGETTWRDYTEEEIAAVETKQSEIAAELEAEAAKEAARAALLAKLGITADEAKLLLG